jgi:histone-lysine N-methyltransferase SETD2
MGENCGNQRFQRREYANVTVKDCGPGKGWGLFSKDTIEKGQFIWEYLGEIIDEETCTKRQEVSR